MTDSNYTHLLTIVDRSGSMWTIRDDMKGALDAFFESQANVPGTCLVDYVQFDDKYDVVFTDKPVSEAKAQLDPRGSTALLDAIGKSVTDLGKRLAEKDEDDRPGKVVVVVVTDGHENSSVDWDAKGVKALVEQQENEWDWDFTFLGANMDAVTVAGAWGFKAGKTMTFNTNHTGATMNSMSEYVTATRSGLDAQYSDSDRNAAVGNNS